MFTLQQIISQNYSLYISSIKSRLVICHIPQKRLAFYLGINPSNLCKILSQKTTPSLKFIFQVESFFDIYASIPNKIFISSNGKFLSFLNSVVLVK